jgi:uncharacterized protein YkwD
MNSRLVTTFVLISATALLILVSLGARSFSEAKTLQFASTQLLTVSPEPKDASIINSGKIGYLHSNSTITATDVTTHYVFLPIVVKPAVPEIVLQVVAETNAERIAYGCPPVTLNIQLTDAAQGHSQDMALNDFFLHIGSDGSSPWERIQATGYQYSWAAENIAAGYSTPESVVAGWMGSDGHRANILNCNLEEIGVGYYYLEDDQGSKNYHHYWTQDLATPR